MRQCHTVLVSLLLLSTLLAASIEAKKVLVLENDVEGVQNITIHCRSNEDDLGVHVLEPHQSFQRELLNSLFIPNLYYCRFDWGGDAHWLDLNDYRYECPICTNVVLGGCEICRWSIKRNGSCLATDNKGSQRCYNWHK
ncbi:unnamed protein product [Linum trigynum]|uniref:S-protein homolog n=1 Tax=Linum trigynum TaxID=586398 RepID=A0AAV2GM02_9ROSI